MVETGIGKGHALCVHTFDRRREAIGVPLGHLDGGFGQVDCRNPRSGLGKEHGSRAAAATDLKHVLAAELREIVAREPGVAVQEPADDALPIGGAVLCFPGFVSHREPFPPGAVAFLGLAALLASTGADIGIGEHACTSDANRRTRRV